VLADLEDIPTLISQNQKEAPASSLIADQEAALATAASSIEPDSPVVSVMIITYNHEKYIAQAVESALAQKVSFPIELVIGEDCSTDGTRGILLGYQRSYPDKVRLLLPERNLGMHRNFIATLAACRGRYVALLEGDDFWTFPMKLQRQVEFLERHPECSTSFHAVRSIRDDDPSYEHEWPDPARVKSYSSVQDLFFGCIVPTCSAVFRRSSNFRFPKWIHDLTAVDWVLHILNAERGSLAFLNETWAVYRVHAGGVWSGRSTVDQYKERIKFYEILRRELDPRFEMALTRLKIATMHCLLIEYWNRGEFSEAEILARRCWAEGPWYLYPVGRVSIALRVYTPGCFSLLSKGKRVALHWLTRTARPKVPRAQSNDQQTN